MVLTGRHVRSWSDVVRILRCLQESMLSSSVTDIDQTSATGCLLVDSACIETAFSAVFQCTQAWFQYTTTLLWSLPADRFVMSFVTEIHATHSYTWLRPRTSKASCRDWQVIITAGRKQPVKCRLSNLQDTWLTLQVNMTKVLRLNNRWSLCRPTWAYIKRSLM